MEFLYTTVGEMRRLVEFAKEDFNESTESKVELLTALETKLSPIIKLQALERLVGDNLTQKFGSDPIYISFEVRQYAKTYELSICLLARYEANSNNSWFEEYKQRLRTAVEKDGKINFDNDLKYLLWDITSDYTLQMIAKTTDEFIEKYKAKPEETKEE